MTAGVERPAASSDAAGLAFAALAYTAWGLFPLYFAQVASVPALEVVVHRSTWSLLLVLLLLAALGRLGALGAALRTPRVVAASTASAVLLAANWLVYVWAVNHGAVIEASLGYFINPLVNVLLGVAVLKERLSRVQWTAVALAAAGVLWLTVAGGRLPWIALVLAVSFGVYGLMRKTAPLGAAEGLALETLLLAPLAIGVLAWWTWNGRGALAGGDGALIGWLLFSGPLTAFSLLCFAAAARRLPMTTLGLMQYVSPTIQFALGVWLFREPFGSERLVGFVLIWAALALYSAEGLGLIRPRSRSPALPR